MWTAQKQAAGHIWPVGQNVPTPKFKESGSKKKKNAMLGNKIAKSALTGLGCTHYQHTINMTSLVILHMEGILMVGCTLIS